MKIILAVAIIAFVFSGCSKEPATPSGALQQIPQKESASGETSQLAVKTAGIVTPNPTSNSSLFIQYSAASAEGRAVGCRFVWYVDGVVVADVSGNMLEPRYFSRGSRVEADVIPVDGSVEGRPFRTQSVTINNTPPVIVSVKLAPVPAYPGDRIRAVPEGRDLDGDTIQYAYQWEVDGKKVDGAVVSEFDTTGLKKKKIIAVTAIPSDETDQGIPFRSDFLVLSNRHPEITSDPPSGMENGVYTYQVAARDSDGDPLVYRLVKSPEGMTINGSTGLIRWEAPGQVAGNQEVTVKVSVDDGDSGVVYQEFSLFLEMK